MQDLEKLLLNASGLRSSIPSNPNAFEPIQFDTNQITAKQSAAETPVVVVKQSDNGSSISGDEIAQSITKQRALDLSIGKDESEHSGLRHDKLWSELFNDFVTACQSNLTIEEMARPTQQTRRKVDDIIDQLFERVKSNIAGGKLMEFSEEQQNRYRALLWAYTFGLGPLDYLFYDERLVTDIHIVTEIGKDGQLVGRVFVNHSKGSSEEPITVDPYLLVDMLRRQLSMTVGRSPTTSTPIVDGQLLNGARVNVVLKPACDPYLSVSIRIPNKSASTMEFLIDRGFLSVAAASFLYLCVRAKLNIVIAGSTGTGKTTLLNAMCKLANDKDRIVTIEDTRELQPGKANWTALITVVNHQGEVVINQSMLVKNALRQMPDRIILGEVRDGAAWDAIHAASTGHRGTMLTIHADDEESIFNKLRLLCEMGGARLQPDSLMAEIGKTIQLAVYIERRRKPDGRYERFVNSIIESNGLFRDGRLNLVPYFKREGDQLKWQNYMPHQNIMRRFLEAQITPEMIRKAIESPVPVWELPEFKDIGC